MRLTANPAQEIRHFDGGESRLKALVSTFGSGAIDGLLQGVGGKDGEGNGDAAGEGDVCEPFGCFACNVIKMRSFAANDSTKTDESVVAALLGDGLGGDRHFPGAGNLEDLDIGFGDAIPVERIERTGQQTVGDEAVEPADEDGEPEALGINVPFEDRIRHIWDTGA